MASTIDSLKREHRAIESVIRALTDTSNALSAGAQVSPDLLDQFIDFIRRFADGCHHHKEELVLFPAMQERGFPGDAGPIGCMLKEHEQGRAFVRRMVAAIAGLRAGEQSAAEEFSAAANGYANLLTEHIYKEDNVLFRMAEGVIGEAALESLAGKFAAAEAELGAEQYEAFEKWAHGLAPAAAAAAR